ncbi:SIMPL domain-containing protein [Xanthomonas bonasiae]|uniref:SIMPL domain-containing protein n=1 Tax=Xanthomonas bonasiae TaxID=2810351 RepID=UPI00197E4A86|nr:SIMPL domain-containing protein [Xanthomonas bonasiae]MBN6112795.1 SIMPL domain-containing protein [Xanthomonas bonasiae]
MKTNTIGRWVIAVLLALPAFASAQVNSLPSQPHLLVKGEAQREVVPDRFGVKITLSAVDADPGASRKRVQANAANVLVAFKQQHALADSVQATTLSIQPEQRYEDNKQVFEGTRVQRTLSADFGSLDHVRGLLGKLSTSEELQVSGISPRYSGEAAARAELKRQAAEQTRISAQALAKAYGVRLGGLYTISEVAPDFAYGIQAGSWPSSGTQVIAEPRGSDIVTVSGSRAQSAAESLEAGSLTLSENVYAVFLIAQ